MGVLDSQNIEDDEADFVVKEVPPMSGPNTKAKPDDDAVKTMLEEIKRENELMKRKLAETEQRSLSNEKRSLDTKNTVELKPEEPEPKRPRGRPAKKDKEPAKPKVEKPKSQAQITKEISKVEKDLKKLQKDYAKAKEFGKEQMARMTEYSDWLNELGTKPEYAHAKSLFDKLNFKMGEIFSMRDELEKLPSYDYPERGEKDHPISIVVDILCFMANAMNTTPILEQQKKHKELKAERQALLALQNPPDEFELQ